MGRKSLNTTDILTAKDPAIRGSLAALHRAAQLARQIAMQTNTSIVVVQDGKRMHISADGLRRNLAGPKNS